MPTTLNTTNWSQALEKNIERWIKEGFDQFPDYIGQTHGIVIDSDLGLVRHQASAGIGFVPQVAEGAATPDTAIQKAYATVYTPKTFRVNIPVTYELYNDDQYAVFMDRARQLGDAAMRTANVYAESVLINSQTSGYTSYGDAQRLGSTTHTNPTGGTAKSNASATGIALNEPNLFTGMRALREQTDDAGVRFMVAENKIQLIIPTAHEKLATEITKSNKKSNANVNDLNFYESTIGGTLVVPWIGASDNAIFAGSDTRWFVTPMKSGMGVKNHLTFIWREHPVYDQWIDKKTKSYNMDVLMRFSYGWSHWLGLWVSGGDSAAYSG